MGQNGFQHLVVEHVGTFEAGDDLQAVGDFVGEYLARLGEMRKHATELRQLDEFQGTALGFVVEDGQVVGRERHISHFHLPAFLAHFAVEALLQLHQRPLAEALVVRQLGDPLGMLHALQLDAGATRAAHVDVLATSAHARADQARAAAEEADIFAGLAQLVGVLAVGISDSLDQRHAEAVGLIDTAVADVTDLAAGVLLDAQLDEADVLLRQLEQAFHAHDGGTLEARRDGAVEVLFTGDMHFAHDVQVRTQGDDDGVVQSLAVDGERRGVVDVVGAGGAVLDAVDDFLLRLELHQGRAVVFA